jgi:serine/threonine-protein kinase
MGTATYFSPEQAEGMGVDARSDIYSLGVVLFEMVTGRPPFMGDTPVAVASKHVRENPPTPRSINPSVPPDLEAIILKCLAKSPEYRYATGDDLRVDLLRFREGRAVGAVAPPMMSQPTMGTTQAVPPYGATQTLSQIAGQETEEPQSRTALYAGLLAVLLVALAVVVLFLGQSLGWWHIGSGRTTVTLQNVAGQSVTQAEHTLHQAGLSTTVHSDSSSSAPNTQVIRTDPPEGTKVQKGSSVELVTGGSGPSVTVQNYKGESVTDAQQAVHQAGLQPKVQVTSFCSEQNVNVVCSQNPKAGSHLQPGKTVTLYTAPTVTPTTTVATASVPNVATETTTAACNAINNAGFTCGSTSTTASELPVNTVVSTNPAAGTTQPKGTTINLVLSSGPASVNAPDVVGMTLAQAEQTIQNPPNNLSDQPTCQTPGTTANPTDPVVAQTPSGGTSVSPGSSIQLTVACSGTATTTTTTS